MHRIPAAILLLVIGFVAALPLAGASGSDDLLRALREGRAVALVRHSNAPGVGDPAGMRLGDCTTQRNLDETGRRDAVALGERLREAGLRDARVFTSRWCRCRDTAALLAFGTPVELPALDSFFGARDQAETRTRALRSFLAELPSGPPAILVTHQVNITALTGVSPATSEMVFVDARPPHAVLGRMR